MNVVDDVRAAQFRAEMLARAGDAPAFNRAVAVTAPEFAKPVAFRAEPGLTVAARLAAQRAGVDPELVVAVAQTESGFNPQATSAAGAQGLMQLMPGTAAAYGVVDPYDAGQNLRGGATYLRDLLARFGGDLRLALAAYNAGPQAVARAGGVPAYQETRAYVARVLAAYDGTRMRAR